MRFPRSDYRPLAPYRPLPEGIRLDLSDNTNLWGTHPAIPAALAQAAGQLARYPTAYGDRVREAVSQRFDVPFECVTTGCGSDDLIDSGFRALVGPGGAVRYLAPTFSMVAHVVATNGLESAPVEAHWRDPARLPEPGALLEGDPPLVYVCTPNNPTATQLPSRWVDEVIERVESQSSTVLFIDEAYADFSGVSWLERAATLQRVVVLRTMSKAYGAAGLRVGFAVGAPTLLDEINKARGPFKVGRASDEAGAAALGDQSGWLEQVVHDTRRNRERLSAELGERGWEVLPSAANFVLIRVPSLVTDAVRARLQQAGIGVREVMLAPGELWMRATVGPWPLMEEFLEALGNCL